MTLTTLDRLQPISGRASRGSATVDRILLQLCERIDALLLEEDRLLAAADPQAFDKLIDRKENLALEVSRVLEMADGYVPSREVRSSLSRTLDLLARQRELVRRHVEAVRSITSMISALYCEATGDGTYDGATHVRALRP
jgi:hypothetical protein